MSLTIFALARKLHYKLAQKKGTKVFFVILQMVWRVFRPFYRIYKMDHLLYLKIMFSSKSRHLNYCDGLNNFDIVYFINLDKRKDRLQEITGELQKTNINPNKINRISAFHEPDFGVLGCSKSHRLALELFLQSDPSNKTCLILEDDFEFVVDIPFANKLIDKIFNKTQSFDVLMLSASVYNYTPTYFNYLIRVFEAETTAGYAVSREFAPTLLKNYNEGISLLEKSGKYIYEYSVDQYFKILQPNSYWYCIKPLIARQRLSQSNNRLENNNRGFFK